MAGTALCTSSTITYRQLSLSSVKGDRIPPCFQLPLQCNFWGDLAVFRQRLRRLSSFAIRPITMHTNAITMLAEDLVLLHR